MNKILLLLFGLSFLLGCQEVHSELDILSPQSKKDVFEVRNLNGDLQTLQPGRYTMTIKFAKHDGDYSEIWIYPPNCKKTIAKLAIKLPSADDFLNVNGVLKLYSDEIDQDFSMLVTRQVDIDEDHIGVTFYDKNFDHIIATSEFRHKSTRVAYDEQNMKFLQSYQKVRYSQRAVVFPIDGGLDWMLEGNLGKDLNAVVNFGAMVLIAPWIYFRYPHVYWILGPHSQYYLRAKWKKAVLGSPVIDYFSFTHEGVAPLNARALDRLPKKKNQLRFVYDEGCQSSSSYYFIQHYNATVAVGHRANSASPLFSFSILRNWTYGASAAKAVYKGYQAGKFHIMALNAVTFKKFAEWGGWGTPEEMLKDSEPMLSWTHELPPSKLFVKLSAVPKRQNALDREIDEGYASRILHIQEGQLIASITGE